MTTETLIATLAVDTEHGLYLDDDSDQYIDWSTRLLNGDYRFEVKGEDGTTALDLTPAQMRALHTQLTLTLLADKD